ncbi:hypothetical protein QZH41_007406 [Actinostola sp. cb2023]|nr:hypothetical protein QZH41_007406 [Actinostola sp. cb2023]
MPWYLVAVYRFILAVYCTGWIIYSGFYFTNGGPKWFIWLTNWGFFFVTLYFILSTVLTLLYHLKEKNQINVDIQMNEPSKHETESGREGAVYELPPRWYHKALWVIYILAANVAVIITCLYWGLINNEAADPEGLALDISNHLFNSVFLVIELLLSSMPIRLLHVVYPVVFTVVYMLFTVIYWAAEGTNPANNKRYIYSYVDYSGNPGLAVMTRRAEMSSH